MDIDIDTPTNFDPCKVFKNVTRASTYKNNILKKHPAGVYFQRVPKDPTSDNLSAIPFKLAEKLDAFKIDFLHLAVLDTLESKTEVRALMDKDPDWTLLQNEEIYPGLFQIRNSFTLVNSVRPTNVLELADCIALLRPGKIHLLAKYINNKEQTRTELYKKNDDKYSFKKGHAVSYAYTIIIQLHQIKDANVKDYNEHFEY